jgi:hypothetical protein
MKRGRMFSKWVLSGALVCVLLPVYSAELIVLNARSPNFKVGMKVNSDAAIALKEGEKLTLIGPDGKSKTLKGPYSGPAMESSSTAADPKIALAALVSTRDARTSSVGVIRAGTASVKIPGPWLIDVSRSGPRCLVEGTQPVWWRPAPLDTSEFVVFPADRSWQADFKWEEGQDRQNVPDISNFEGAKAFIVRSKGEEYGISILPVPAGIDNPMVLTSWLLEKGCIQQADALIAQLKEEVLETR